MEGFRPHNSTYQLVDCKKQPPTGQKLGSGKSSGTHLESAQPACYGKDLTAPASVTIQSSR
jgi:hypothetical protein